MTQSENKDVLLDIVIGDTKTGVRLSATHKQGSGCRRLVYIIDYHDYAGYAIKLLRIRLFSKGCC